MSAPLEAYVLEVLSRIGLGSPVPGDALHVRLVATVRRLGPGAQVGSYLAALRFDFAWELRDAGRAYAIAKADYERAIAAGKVREMASPTKDGRRMSLGWAEAIAEDAAYELKLQYLVAEQKERAMRKFLDAIDSAVSLHQTDRADLRKADFHHAQGVGGGS